MIAALPSVFLAAAQPSYELQNYDPIADASAVVTSGKARFTVLTPQLLRIEWASSGKFEDRATLAFVNRKLPVPKFTTRTTSDGLLTIQTSAVTLSYEVGKPFGAATLSVVPATSDSKVTKWTPGAPSSGNLLGTIRSLDMIGAESLNCTEVQNVTVHGESLHCEWGLVSRDGWSLVDDTPNWALTAGAEWWDTPNTDDSDWYLFAHGHDYKQAVKDYTKVGGAVPLVPRYALGVWFTRWYDFNNYGVKRLVDKFRERTLPLDVYVTDMNWHKKDNWGGWTFDPNLYPFPDDTFGWLHAQGLATSANLHDANGVGSYDKMFPQMCAAMGLDPANTTTVEFSIVNKTYAYALDDIVLGDVADKIDFMWIDWQQGGTQGGAAGGKQNPTIMTNKLRVTDPKRQRGGAFGTGKRGMVLARWGGLGSHRYPVGFSGDVDQLTWANLAYQPYFSLTAANVAYGMWSHDVEGPGDDPEMYVRWVQWAAYSGVLRLHERGMSAGGCAGDVPGVRSTRCANVRPWEVAEMYYAPIRAALVARGELVPYLYTAARESYESGLGLLRPMYFEHPEEEEAYLARPNGSFAQYYLGPDLLVSPVTTPIDNATRLATRSVWLPPSSSWYEVGTGALLEGGTTLTKGYDLTEVPLFVRAGAVVPSTDVGAGATTLGGAMSTVYSALTFSIYPGATEGSGVAYEDDGVSDEYLVGHHATVTCSYAHAKAGGKGGKGGKGGADSGKGGAAAAGTTTTTITLARNGSFPQQGHTPRVYHVAIVSTMPPASVTALGRAVPHASSLAATAARSATGAASWWYDGPSLTLHLTTDAIDLSTAAHTFKMTTIAPVDDAQLSGLKGVFAHANLAKDNFDMTRSEPGAHDTHGGALSKLSSVGDGLSYQAAKDPAGFIKALGAYKAGLAAAIAEIGTLKGPRAVYSQALLATALN